MSLKSYGGITADFSVSTRTHGTASDSLVRAAELLSVHPTNPFPLVVSWKPYDNTGAEYQVERILNADGTFNLEQYKAYSPLFLSCVSLIWCASRHLVTLVSSTSFSIAYGLSFASITATIVHSILYFWKPIRVHLRRSLREQPDIHAKLMSNYRQVPEWWYAILFSINFIFACLSIQLWPTHLPIWALVIALLIGT